MAGEAIFELRDFSGADFARLVRNFEITATSAEESGRIRGAALALYLTPALAAGAAFLHQLRGFNDGLRGLSAAALLLARGYGVLALGATLFLSLVAVNDFERYVGAPRLGFYVSAAGLLLLGSCGVWELRRARPPAG